MIAKANKLQRNRKIKDYRKYHIQNSYYWRLHDKNIKETCIFRIILS